ISGSLAETGRYSFAFSGEGRMAVKGFSTIETSPNFAGPRDAAACGLDAALMRCSFDFRVFPSEPFRIGSISRFCSGGLPKSKGSPHQHKPDRPALGRRWPAVQPIELASRMIYSGGPRTVRISSFGHP